jgi:transposase
MVRNPRKYSKEFKEESVNLALRSPSIAKTAEELGIPIPTMHTWIKKLKDSKSIEKGQDGGQPNMAVLIEENRRLHKELTVAREEREILKKAAAYFAQNQK